jgi:hypothetical protein
MTALHLPAAQIPVKSFRQILIWPLLIHDTSGAQKIDLNAVTAKLKKNHWDLADESSRITAARLRSLPWYGADKDYDYSEIVYFHSYVRDFLYGGDGVEVDKRPMRVFRRRDIGGLTLKLDDLRNYQLNVIRVEGYLFESGVLLIVIEVDEPTRIEGATAPLAQTTEFTLKDALDVQNVLRMVFPRRWNDKGKPSEAPLRTSWLDSQGKEIKESVQDFRLTDDFTCIARVQAELPAAKHWRYLLQPFPIYGEHKAGDFAIKQIEDQRIPSMSYLAVPDPRAISEWDFARIAFLDSAGESSVGSYSDEFLCDWAKTSAYDRFWQRVPSAGGKEVEEHNTMMRTRWLCSGYGFAVVGADEDSFFKGQIAANFHHHYFRMGLIAHFHRATILTLRDQLAEATKTTHNQKEFRRRVMMIQQEMTSFRARFWFREVSTQVQGQEIFSWWSDRLGNQSLFDHVTADIAAAEAQMRTEFDELESTELNRITKIGGLIGIISVPVSLASLVASLLALEGSHPQLPFSFVTSGLLYRLCWFVVLAIFPLVLILSMYFGCRGIRYLWKHRQSKPH